MTTTLALKHRPKSWEELVGQDIPRKLLSGMINSGAISPGYLFSGMTGCGKTSAAMLFAKRLLCLNPVGANPCCVCQNCHGMDTGASQNLLYVEGGTDRGVDFVKNTVIKTLRAAPVGADYRVVVIDEVHQYKRDAISPFLTLLEKMPKRSVLIFCTTEADKVLPEITNRCTPIIFSRINSNQISSRITELFPDIDSDALEILANRCSGSFRSVWSVLDAWKQTEEPLTEELIRKLMGSVSNADRAKLWLCLRAADVKGATKLWKSWSLSGASPRQVGLDLLEDLTEQAAESTYSAGMIQGMALLSGCALINETNVWLPALLSLIPLLRGTDPPVSLTATKETLSVRTILDRIK